jgi:hypothetical protein
MKKRMMPFFLGEDVPEACREAKECSKCENLEKCEKLLGEYARVTLVAQCDREIIKERIFMLMREKEANMWAEKIKRRGDGHG